MMSTESQTKTADVVSEYAISVEQIKDFEFLVKFDKENHPDLELDEPPPLGGDKGPNAGRLLAAAVGNCLSASMLFCSRKAKVNVEKIETKVTVQVIRTENRRQRIGKLSVEITPQIAAAQHDEAARCMEIFEDFCTITQSVRQGIPVEVTIKGFEDRAS
jgi:organic hydroperoxide reductase OsmC/OhrA